jgi:hypothetical protein
VNDLSEDFEYSEEELSCVATVAGSSHCRMFMSKTNTFSISLVSNGCNGPERFRARVKKGKLRTSNVVVAFFSYSTLHHPHQGSKYISVA